MLELKTNSVESEQKTLRAVLCDEQCHLVCVVLMVLAILNPFTILWSFVEIRYIKKHTNESQVF